MQKPLFIQQRDQTDCGVACLLMIIRMHGGDASLENLRIQSGTSIQGTTLLGLQQAAELNQLTTEAFEVDDLCVFRKEASFPCILHVCMEGKLWHYVVCFEATSTSYAIIDPAKGITQWTEEQLLAYWQSRAVLVLSPTAQFEQKTTTQKRKRQWLYGLIKQDLPLVYIAAAMGLVLAIFGMATAIYSQKLVDDFLPNKKHTQLWIGIALLTFLLFARAGVSYIRTLVLARQAKAINNRLFEGFYDKLLYLPAPFFTSRKIGDLIARLHDTRRIQSVISYLLGSVMIDVIVTIVSLGFLFYYSWLVALITLLCIPLVVGLVVSFNNRVIDAQKQVMNQFAFTESHFVDTFSGILTIKSTNNELAFSKLGKFVYDKFQNQVFSLSKLGAAYGLRNDSIQVTLTSILLGVTSYLVWENNLRLGEMMATLTIGIGMVGAISRLAVVNIQWQEALVAFNRMFEYTEYKESIIVTDSIIKPDERIDIITIQNLSFRFAGKRPLFSDLNFTITRGEITLLIGEIGSGKSILLQIIQKFLQPDTGRIIINNRHILQEVDSVIWRNRVSILPQEIKIFNGTLVENIFIGGIDEAQLQEKGEFLSELGFDRFFGTLPQGYLTLVGEEGINLSGGQKQLVGLARAIVHQPEILLLDEPTAALDTLTELFVAELLQKLSKQMGILMVTHRRSTFAWANRIIELQGEKRH